MDIIYYPGNQESGAISGIYAVSPIRIIDLEISDERFEKPNGLPIL
jgi:hypothetical protein